MPHEEFGYSRRFLENLANTHVQEVHTGLLKREFLRPRVRAMSLAAAFAGYAGMEAELGRSLGEPELQSRQKTPEHTPENLNLHTEDPAKLKNQIHQLLLKRIPKSKWETVKGKMRPLLAKMNIETRQDQHVRRADAIVEWLDAIAERGAEQLGSHRRRRDDPTPTKLEDTKEELTQIAEFAFKQGTLFHTASMPAITILKKGKAKKS